MPPPACRIILLAATAVNVPVKLDGVVENCMLSISRKLTLLALVILTISTLLAVLLATTLPAPIISKVLPAVELKMPLIVKVDPAVVVPT